MKRVTASFHVADWLGLAATPTFVLMALLTAIAGDSHTAMMQQSLHTGMVPMYMLMAAFHLAPWLRLTAGPRSQSE